MKDINIGELGIINLMILATCVAAIITSIITFIWLINNWRKYRINIKGAIYREKHGLFNISQYADNIIPASVPRRQKNRGPKPEVFDRDIPCVNYFEILDFDTIKSDTKGRKNKGKEALYEK